MDITEPKIEELAKFYFAYNATDFNEGKKASCQIGVHPYQYIASVSMHNLFQHTKHGHGTSGGPYIKNGKVIAIHIEPSKPNIKKMDSNSNVESVGVLLASLPSLCDYCFSCDDVNNTHIN